MNNKKLLIFTLAIGLLASHCLEGMEKKKKQLSDLLKKEADNVMQMHYKAYCEKDFLQYCKENPSLSYRIKFPARVGGHTTSMKYKTTEHHVNKMIENCNVIGLDLSYCYGVNLEKVNWSSIKNLLYLNIREVQFTEEALNEIFSTQKDIKELNLYSYRQSFGAYSLNLKETNLLNLNDLKSITVYDSLLTADYLNKMGEKFENLEEFYFTGNSDYSYLTVGEIKWELFKNLRILQLDGPKISEDDILKIAEHCKKLEKLILFDGGLVLTGKALGKLREPS